MTDAVPLSGSIDPGTFPFLLVQLHRSGATGSFKVDGPSYQKALYFRGGRILFGSSNDPRDQLGAILIESGKITPEQLEDVSARVGPGNPLAKVLSDTGFVSQRELSEAARAKVERIYADVIAYESGSFEFEDGVLPKGAVDLKLHTERLIVSAVRHVPDRAFVLRHLGSVSAVLLPSAGLAGLLPEIHAEVGRLPEQFDGRTTLKEAAAGAGVDEFDAAKVACALLFLGAVERQAAPGTAPGEAEAPAFIGAEEQEPPSVEPARAADTGPPVIALDDVARAAMEPEPQIEPEPPPFAAQAESPAIEAEPAPFTIGAESTPAPEAEPSEPTIVMAPEEPPIFVPAAEPPPIAMEPPPPEPAPVAPPPQPPVRIEPERPARTATSRAPVIPPPSAREEARESPRAATREDLAAVDALLHSRVPEGPLAPLETARGERWAPKFGTAPDRGRARPHAGGGAGKRVLLFGGGALALVAAAAAGWFFLGEREEAPPVPPVTASPAQDGLSSIRGGGVADPGSAATPGPATPAPATPAPADGAALLRAGQHAAAGQAFTSALRAAGPSAATIQLLIACSTETIDKAVASAGGPDLVILPTVYQGRQCYRVCWGVYPSAAQATSAVGAVPGYFSRNGGRPRVLSAREVLP